MRLVGRVYQTTSSGAGVLLLDGGAPSGYLAFADRYAPGETMTLLVRGQTGGQWQTGLYEYQTGPDRVALLEAYDGSSGLGVPVTFVAGVKDVKVDAPDRLLNATLEYVHAQDVPAATWTVMHNLGRRPSVRVVDSGGTVVYGGIEYVDANTLRLHFAAGFGGKAFVN